MLEPNKIPSGGFNQEYRQHPKIPGGYIYSHTGDSYSDYMRENYPLMPETISFSTHQTFGAFQRDQPGTNILPVSSVIYPYPGSPPASMPWKLTVLAGSATIDLLLIARILSVKPLSDEPSSSADSNSADSTTVQWYRGLIERHTVETIKAGATLYELVGTAGDRWALVSAFNANSGSGSSSGSQSTLDLPPPPPGYTYSSTLLDKDFTVICRQFAHILINTGYNFQRYVAGRSPD